jgi:hypothetical protein
MNSETDLGTLDPYSLLGVNLESSESEVRKAYYDLAKLTHPDKGGRSEDMLVVDSAYKWILAGLKNAKRECATFEDEERSFQDFLKSQNEENVRISFDSVLNNYFGYNEAKLEEILMEQGFYEKCPVPLQDFRLSVIKLLIKSKMLCATQMENENENIHELWLNTARDVVKSDSKYDYPQQPSKATGYEKYMVPSYKDTNDVNDVLHYEPIVQLDGPSLDIPKRINTTRAVTLYDEDFYTIFTKGTHLGMTDYMKAYSDTETRLDIEDESDATPILELYEKLMKERGSPLVLLSSGASINRLPSLAQTKEFNNDPSLIAQVQELTSQLSALSTELERSTQLLRSLSSSLSPASSTSSSLSSSEATSNATSSSTTLVAATELEASLTRLRT